MKARSTGLEDPGQGKAAGRRPPGLEQPGDRGPPTARTGTCRAEQGGRQAAPRTGASGERRRTAPYWTIRGLNRKEEPTTYEPQEQPGTRGWAGATGADQQWQDHKPQARSIEEKKARSTGPEHPGQSKAAGRRPPGLEQPRKEGEQPRTGSSGADQEGGATSEPIPVSTGDRSLVWSNWS